MSNVLVTGSRKATDVAKIFDTLKKELKKGDVVIHGGAFGADNIAQAYCEQHDVTMVVVRPVYETKSEYYLHRNAEMVGMADRVIAFPLEGSVDKSRGTWFTIRYAKARKLDVKVVALQ